MGISLECSPRQHLVLLTSSCERSSRGSHVVKTKPRETEFLSRETRMTMCVCTCARSTFYVQCIATARGKHIQRKALTVIARDATFQSDALSFTRRPNIYHGNLNRRYYLVMRREPISQSASTFCIRDNNRLRRSVGCNRGEYILRNIKLRTIYQTIYLYLSIEIKVSARQIYSRKEMFSRD